MSDQNPYKPVAEPPTGNDGPKKRSRVPWMLIPAVIGFLLGGPIGRLLPSSPGDPMGLSQGSGLGGFIGLGIGLLLFNLARPRK